MQLKKTKPDELFEAELVAVVDTTDRTSSDGEAAPEDGVVRAKETLTEDRAGRVPKEQLNPEDEIEQEPLVGDADNTFITPVVEDRVTCCASEGPEFLTKTE